MDAPASVTRRWWLLATVLVGIAAAAALIASSSFAAAQNKGGNGPPWMSSYEVVGPEVTWEAGSTNTTIAECPGDKVAIGGGYSIEGGNRTGVTVLESAPTRLAQQDDGTWTSTAWKVRGVVDDNGAATMQAFVTCVTTR